jgi:hypothetical protein
MSRSFDYDKFVSKSLTIIVHGSGKTFAQLAREVEALRKEHKGLRDKTARKYIRRDLNRRLLMVALDTSQPGTFIDRLFDQNVRQGFNDLHAEVSSVIEYAHYCNERGKTTKGLRVLQKMKKAILRRKGISAASARNFLKAIERSTLSLKGGLERGERGGS